MVKPKIDRHRTKTTIALLATICISVGCWNDSTGKSTGDSFVAAASDGDLETLKSILQSGVNVNYQPRNGMPALYIASANGHYDVVEFLVVYPGIDLNCMTTGSKMTPLAAAASYEHNQIVALLLKYRADPNRGWPLGSAAVVGNIEAMKLLLDIGADVDQVDSFNVTPLITAAYHGHSEAVRLLLTHNANVAVIDERGKTAKDWAEAQPYKNKESDYADILNALNEVSNE